MILTCFFKKHLYVDKVHVLKPIESSLCSGSVPGHLYVIKEREFLKTNELILKIGKTTRIKSRMPAYPKNSRIMAICYCSTNVHEVEKRLIALFDERFIKRRDIGNEYYEGIEKEMVFAFLQHMVELG